LFDFGFRPTLQEVEKVLDAADPVGGLAAHPSVHF
jgi:hypothetical protein